VNVLLAVADTEHMFHRSIHEWLGAHRDEPWATCPLTENGFVRILSQPSYRGSRLTTAEAVETLRGLKAATGRRHVFWSDEISITDQAAIDRAKIAGHGQITDVYLAALALRKHGRVVTFDTAIPWQAVVGATAKLIEIPPV
jgi:toxin-antitoxin system PIN domain toxin